MQAVAKAKGGAVEDVTVCILDRPRHEDLVREVRQEVAKVTWPTRKETLITTGLVLAMSALAAIFFLVVDKLVQLASRLIFGLG